MELIGAGTAEGEVLFQSFRFDEMDLLGNARLSREWAIDLAMRQVKARKIVRVVSHHDHLCLSATITIYYLPATSEPKPEEPKGFEPPASGRKMNLRCAN